MKQRNIRLFNFVLLASLSGLFGACNSESSEPESLGSAQQRIVYGADERLEVGQLANPQLAWANATGSFFDDTDVNCSEGNCALTTRPYGDSQGGVYIPLCSGEPFAGQPQGSHCTGFLIAPDLVATAGHCFVSNYDCQHSALVFGFAVDTSGQAPTTVPETNVYRCSEIVAQVVENASASALGDEDFAIIRLDRPVTDRTPFSLRQTGTVADDAVLASIGGPYGLPLKYAGGAFVRSNTGSAKFEINLDAAAGTSGGPVFDAVTGLVEGIVANGPGNGEVYESNPEGGSCWRERHCNDATGCENQAAWVKPTRIQSVIAVLENRSCHDKVLNGQETDVGCGGPECNPCDVGKACQIASDCWSQNCRAGVCAPAPVRGDVNGDGVVNIVDAQLVAQAASGMGTLPFPDVADVNCSGGVDVVDALLIAQLSAGSIDQFPCQ